MVMPVGGTPRAESLVSVEALTVLDPPETNMASVLPEALSLGMKRMSIWMQFGL